MRDRYNLRYCGDGSLSACRASLWAGLKAAADQLAAAQGADPTKWRADATAERLNLQDSDDALMLVILTVDKEPADATANLMGPIVVNRHTLDAAQVVLTGSDYEVRTPLATAS